MKKGIIILIILLIAINMFGCRKVRSVEVKQCTINSQGEGWQVKNCIIEVYSNGDVKIIEGYILIDQKFELVSFEIYQDMEDSRSVLYNTSFTTVSGVVINHQLKGFSITDKSVDLDLELKAEIILIRDKYQAEEKIVLDVNLI